MRFTVLMPLLGVLLVACPDPDSTGDTDAPDLKPEGCFQVTGASQGYEFFLDAQSAAADGATITLCEDIGLEVIIDRPLTIDGAGFVLRPPTNKSAVRIIDGGELTISNVDVVSTRSAFVVEGGGVLTLTDSTLSVVPNYGVDVQPGAAATVQGVTMNAPGWGGVKVSSGTLDMSDTTIENPGAYGVYIEEDGSANISDSTIVGALHNDSSNSLWDIDGVGVWLETGASAALSGNLIVNSAIAGVSADDSASLTMDGDTVGGGFAGLTIRNTRAEISNVLVDAYFQYGILCLDCSDLKLHSTVVQTTPESAPFDNVSTNPSNGSMGLFGIEASITVTGTPEAPSQFNGNNHAGILVQPQGGGDTAFLDMSNTEVRDNAAFGMSIRDGELVMTDSAVIGSRKDDVNCITDSGYACNMGLALWGSNATLTNSDVLDSEDWGLTIVNAVADITGGHFGGNEAYGIFTQTASINVDGTNFDGGRRVQVYMNQTSTGLIENATFQNGQYESAYEYQSGGQTIRSVNYYQADDIQVYDSDLVIQNTTFQDGESGITGYGFSGTASVSIQDSTFSRYNSDPIFAGTGATFTVDRVNFDEIGQRAAYCSSGVVTMDKVRIDNVTKYKYRNEQYADGELRSETVFDQVGQAIYGYQCDYTFEDVVIDGTDGQPISLNSSSIEVDGLSIANPFRDGFGTAVMQLSWSNVGSELGYPSAYLNDLSITGVGDVDALRMNGWAEATGELAAGTVSITGLSVEANAEATTGGDGVDATDLSDLQITGLDMSGIRQVGLRLTRTNATIVGAAGSATGIIEAPGANGVYIDAVGKSSDPAKVSLDALTVNAAGTDGIYVSQGTHSFTDVTVTAAGDYGAECVDASFDVCQASLDGASGPHLDCGACDVAD